MRFWKRGGGGRVLLCLLLAAHPRRPSLPCPRAEPATPPLATEPSSTLSLSSDPSCGGMLACGLFPDELEELMELQGSAGDTSPLPPPPSPARAS